LEFVEVNPPASHNEVLEALERGDMTVEEALKELKKS
jgi:hypothetical protein